MNTGIEKRRHPRIPLWWPVILRSQQGPILGTIKNISVNGAHIFCLEPIKNENEFQIILKPPKGDDMPITCKKVWSDIEPAGNTDYNTIGVRFVKISSTDQDIIASLVAEYSPVKPQSRNR